MADPKSELLARITAEVAANGLADRSLRDIAESVGTSHRMVLYHFGDRAGLVSAIVEATEAAQRDVLTGLAEQTETAEELIMALWRHVSSEDLRPFVRLFFEVVAATGARGLTDPWLDIAETVTETIGETYDPRQIRVGIAVTRGLLIDVLADDSATEATEAMESFVAMWARARASAQP